MDRAKQAIEKLKTFRNESVQAVVTWPPLNLDQSPEKYVADMVEVFREVRRVLKPDGTLWITLMDSYHSVVAQCDTRDGDRFTLKRAANVQNHAIQIPLNGTETDIMAVSAERLVADCLGRRVDKLEATLEGDDCDLWFRGYKVNVKWTPRSEGRLVASVRDVGAHPCDIYVLVCGGTVEDPTSMKIRGWVWRSELVDNVVDLGHGDCYALQQSELRPFNDLAINSARLKPGDLIGLPWMVAFGLRADGWYLRLVMPGKEQEYTFLFTKEGKGYKERVTANDVTFDPFGTPQEKKT